MFLLDWTHSLNHTLECVCIFLWLRNILVFVPCLQKIHNSVYCVKQTPLDSLKTARNWFTLVLNDSFIFMSYQTTLRNQMPEKITFSLGLIILSCIHAFINFTFYKSRLFFVLADVIIIIFSVFFVVTISSSRTILTATDLKLDTTRSTSLIFFSYVARETYIGRKSAFSNLVPLSKYLRWSLEKLEKSF